MTIQPGAVLNTQSFGNRPESVEVPRISTVSPTSSDVNHPIGKRWINTAANLSFELTSISTIGGIATATWTQTGTPGGALNTLTTQDSTVVVPSAGNINVVGSGTIQTTGAGSTVTISTTAGSFPITPFVVGPVGKAGYQTIQSAVNAANAAGGGAVWIQPGTYTENLTLFTNVQLVGAVAASDIGGGVTLIGVHTPPTSGNLTISDVNLQSTTHIFNSAAAGSTTIFLTNLLVNITSGFIFNLPNWTGEFITYNLGDISTNNGVVNNTGGSTCFFVSATHGGGTGQTMITSGTVTLNDIVLNCPWNAETGTTVACDYTIFNNTVTLSNNSTGLFSDCRFATGATPAITMSSSAAINVANSIINSSNNPAISGSGAGTLSLGSVTFLNNSSIANTLTVAWYATKTGASTITGAFTQVGTALINTTGTAATTIGGSSGLITLASGAGGVTMTGGGNTISLFADAAANVVTLGSTTASASLTLQSGSGGNTLIAGNVAATITIGATAQTATITLGSSSASNSLVIAGGSGATTLTLANVQTGGSIAAGTGMTTGTISIGGTAQTGTITLGSSSGSNTLVIAGGTGATTLQLANAQTAGSVSIGSAMTTGTIAIGGTGLQTGTITIGGGTGAQTLNFGTGGTGVKTIHIGDTASVANVISIGSLTGTLTSNCPTLITLASGAGTGLAVDTSAGTGVAATFKSTNATTDAIEILPSSGGIKVNPTVVTAGASPQTCNNRFGSVTFSGVSIASGGTQAFVINNTTVAANNTVIKVAWFGATQGSALSIQSITSVANTSFTVTMTNGTSATMVTSSANITFVFWVMN